MSRWLAWEHLPSRWDSEPSWFMMMLLTLAFFHSSHLRILLFGNPKTTWSYFWFAIVGYSSSFALGGNRARWQRKLPAKNVQALRRGSPPQSQSVHLYVYWAVGVAAHLSTTTLAWALRPATLRGVPYNIRSLHGRRSPTVGWAVCRGCLHQSYKLSAIHNFMGRWAKPPQKKERLEAKARRERLNEQAYKSRRWNGVG